MVNPSTELGRGIVQTLINAGVTDVVVSPGSRNAPISYALAQASAANLLTLHVRIDEREAGFLALGLAKASGIPTPVVVTSGSAVANLLPAIVEAHYSGIPVVAITADRTADVRGHGAPQAIDQVGIFSTNVRSICDVNADNISAALDAVRHTVDAAVSNQVGPVHVNVQFALPLMPEDIEWIPTPWSMPETTPRAHDVHAEEIEVPGKGLLIVGDLSMNAAARDVVGQAEELGWPIIWEPTSNVHSHRNALSHGALVLASGKAPTPDVVITLGAVGLSRATMNLLKTTKHISIKSDRFDIPDPVLSAAQIIDGSVRLIGKAHDGWIEEWQSIDNACAKIVAEKLSTNELSGPRVAVQLWNHVHDSEQLFIAASWPVRHIESYAPTRRGVTTFGNRGTNGIDGLISTAWGIASAHDTRTYALVGDIAFLYGVAGLNVSDMVQRPNLTIVVSDNDGSGIFGQLEQGAPTFANHFEEVFGTPHGRDLWVIAESFGIPATRVTSPSQMQSALDNSDRIPGVHVIICTTSSRSEERLLVAEINSAIAN